MMEKTRRHLMSIDLDMPIKFGDLPHLIAIAMYPDEDQSVCYGAARLNVESELEEAAQQGLITPRNAVSFGEASLLVGEALKVTVVFPWEISDYLSKRGIALVNQSETKTRLRAIDKKKNTWGEHELRQLLAKSLEPGQKQEKLASAYGVSRQFIGKKLAAARKLDTPRKAHPFAPLARRK
jgi:hypothetical protein